MFYMLHKVLESFKFKIWKNLSSLYLELLESIKLIVPGILELFIKFLLSSISFKCLAKLAAPLKI